MSDDNIIYLIPPGNIRCFITDKLRKDKPEENVRQRWARSLVDEYGYFKNDLAIEFPIRMGTAKKSADIVVFKAGGTKQEDIKASDKSKGEGQLKSYMAASSSCKYGLWVGKERYAFEKLPDG